MIISHKHNNKTIKKKTYDNMYRTNRQNAIQMLSLTHTYDEITQDVRHYIQDKTHKHTTCHTDALTDTHP